MRYIILFLILLTACSNSGIVCDREYVSRAWNIGCRYGCVVHGVIVGEYFSINDSLGFVNECWDECRNASINLSKTPKYLNLTEDE